MQRTFAFYPCMVRMRHTSSVFEKGKVTLMKMVQKSENVQSASEIQCDHWATREEIREASMKIFVEMYGGTKECLLRKLRRALLFPFSKFLLIECQQFSRHLPFSYLLCLSVLSNCYISAFTFTFTQQSHLKIYLVLLPVSTNRTTHISNRLRNTSVQVTLMKH